MAILHILQFLVAGELQSLSLFSWLHHQPNTITAELHLFSLKRIEKEKNEGGGKKEKCRSKLPSQEQEQEQEQDAAYLMDSETINSGPFFFYLKSTIDTDFQGGQ